MDFGTDLRSAIYTWADSDSRFDVDAFDAWLKSVKAEAWDEGSFVGAGYGYLQGRANGGEHPDLAPNPYRNS